MKSRKDPKSLDLSNLEEIIWRTNQGISVDINAPLAKKSAKKDILNKLEEIEREIINKAMKRCQ